MIRLILLTVCISGTLSGVTTSVRQILGSFHGDSQCLGIFCGVPPDVEEDANLLVPGLLTKYGYPVEVHSVTTADGYILDIHRIPNPGAQPVFLQHGLLDSSATWIIMGPNQGLAYLLHDMGYDVWMGNSRGNRYSKRHRTLNVDSRDFWDFSFHELGIHDLPTMIDHILNQTNHAKLHYIGHSQGTAAFWVMTSERPQYNEKILSMHALAPVAYLDHVRSPFIKFMVKLLSGVHAFTKLFGIKQFLPSSWLLSEGGKVLCEEGSLLQSMCTNILFVISGHNSLQLNRTMLPVLLAHTPAGASVKQMVHLGQLAKFGRFQYYDAGLLSNIDQYSWITPPEYNLKKVTAPVFLYYSKNDWLIGVQDAERLWGNLPNVYARFLIEETRFNHLDFVWAIDARPLLYNRLVQMLQYMDKEQNNKIGDTTNNFDDNNNLNLFTLKTY